MLDVIYRTVLGNGPAHFKAHLKVRRSGSVVDPLKGKQGKLERRSTFGLVAVYNNFACKLLSSKKRESLSRSSPANGENFAKEGDKGWKMQFTPRIH